MGEKDLETIKVYVWKVIFGIFFGKNLVFYKPISLFIHLFFRGVLVNKNFFTKTLIVVMFLSAFFGFTQQSVAQLKIGYVNSETILKELPEAKEAQSKLEGMVKVWQDELEKMSKSLQEKYEDYQKKQSMYNETVKQAEQKKLLEEEQKMNLYRQEKFGQQGELAMQREKIMKPIQDKVFKSIEKIAKDQKLSFVFDKATDVPLLYADASYDYTYKVIDMLKRGGK